MQASRVIPQLRRLVTAKVNELLKDLATNKIDDYAKFWNAFGRFIKEGVATDRESADALTPFLRFHTLRNPQQLTSLDDYIQQLKPSQKKIYYILGDDDRSATRSPHLDLYRHQDVDVLLMTDPLDSFVLLNLSKYKEYELANVAVEKPDVPDTGSNDEPQKADEMPQELVNSLIERFKTQLGEKVADVRTTDRLLDSPVRLVDKEGSPNQEVQRVYRMLKQDYQVPQRILEINPSHLLLQKLAALEPGDQRVALIIDQLYENALLIEGLHPDPASMISRIQDLMARALE